MPDKTINLDTACLLAAAIGSFNPRARAGRDADAIIKVAQAEEKANSLQAELDALRLAVRRSQAEADTNVKQVTRDRQELALLRKALLTPESEESPKQLDLFY